MKIPHSLLVLSLIFVCASLSAYAAPVHPAVVRAEFIHEPTAYPECHASTIVETTAGGLLAAWFGGTAESNPDVCIYVSR